MPKTVNKIQEHITRIGKLKIIKEITEGMNAYAYHCVHKQLNDDRFVKVCYYEPELAKELLKEPRLLIEALKTTTNADNLVQVHEAEILEIDGEKHLCIQMEFIKGPSLLRQLTESKLGMIESIRLASKLLNGIAQLHYARLVHRDLKPGNIMWNDGELKITDFGSIALISDGDEYVAASKHSALYVPPEGWKNPSTYNFSSDLYQAGIVLYEMINGPLIYEPSHYLTRTGNLLLRGKGQKYEELHDADKTQIVNDCIAERAKAKKLLVHGRKPRPYVSKQIARIINKATNPDWKKRYSSASAFLSDLGAVTCPNWHTISEGEFIANDWHNRDWHVLIKGKRKRELVLKSKPAGGQNYRRVSLKPSATLNDAFYYVNSLR